MSEYKNTQPEGQEGEEKFDLPGANVADARTDVRTGVNGALLDPHAEAVRRLREYLPERFSEFAPNLGTVAECKNELLLLDPGLLNDAALKTELVDCAVQYWGEELPRFIREFGLTDADVRTLIKPRLIQQMLSWGGTAYGIATTVFPNLGSDPEWIADAKRWYVPEWQKGKMVSACRMNPAFFGPEFFTDDVIQAAAEGIGKCVAAGGVSDAVRFLKNAGDAGGHRAQLERVFDTAAALRSEKLIQTAEAAGVPELARRGRHFVESPAAARTADGAPQFYEWQRAMQSVLVLEDLLRDHGGKALSQISLLSMQHSDYHHFTDAALSYCSARMRGRLPGLKLERLHARIENGAKTAYYHDDRKLIGLAPGLPVNNLFEAMGEEIGHAARYELGPQDATQEKVTHEFFGYLGRIILFQETRQTSMAGYFERDDGIVGIDSAEEVNLMYYPRPKKADQRWRWGRKLWRNARGVGRKNRLDARKNGGAETSDPLDDMQEDLHGIPAGKERDLAAEYRTAVIHQRGYKYASTHFTPDVVERVDFEKIFSLPDREVRKRFFRPDPDFSGPWKDVPGEKPA